MNKTCITERSCFTELWKLVQIFLVLPLNTAACERGFSLMNSCDIESSNPRVTGHLVVNSCGGHIL